MARCRPTFNVKTLTVGFRPLPQTTRNGSNGWTNRCTDIRDVPFPRDETTAKALKKRALTNLYNARPQWLVDAHAALDTAVAVAYGWSADITDDDALRELLALNGGG